MSFVWDGGARSIAELPGDGWFTFVVPQGAAGVVAGLNGADAGAGYHEISHGFQVSGGRYRIIEAGDPKTPWEAFAAGTRFCVLRHAGAVYYLVGTTPTHTTFPNPGGALVRKTQPAPTGALFLDSSLLVPGDRIADLAHVDLRGTAGGSARFPSMQAGGVVAEHAVAIAELAPMQAHAEADSTFGVRAVSAPVDAVAYVAGYVGATNAFAPMRAGGSPYSAEIELAGAVNTLLPAAALASAGTFGEPIATNAFEPMEAVGYVGAHAAAWGTFPPMLAAGWGASATERPYFDVVLPALRFDPSVRIESVAVAEDVVEAHALRRAVSDVVAEDEVFRRAVLRIESVAVAIDAVRQGSQLRVVDEVVAEDDAVPGSLRLRVVSVAVAEDELTAGGVIQLRVVSTAIAEDAVRLVSRLQVESVAVGDDAQRIRTVLRVESVGAAEDAAVPGGRSLLQVESIAVADDAVVVSGTVRVQVESVAVAEDGIVVIDSEARAWVLNTESEGVSWYSRFQFYDIAQVGDRVLAVGPRGIFELEGDTDDGAPIHAGVAYGFNELGGYDEAGRPKASEMRKRVSDLYVAYTSDATLECTVGTYGSNHPPYTYALPERRSDAPINNRAPIGRGLVGRYWQIEINNTDGARFSVKDVSVLVVNSMRRIG